MDRFAWLAWMTATMVWPLYLVAALSLLIVGLYRRSASGARELPVVPVLGLLFAPTLLTLWATLTFGSERGAAPGQFGWASSILTCIAVAVVIAAGLALWRWRAQWWVVAPGAIASVLATALSWFVGAMAIADDWI